MKCEELNCNNEGQECEHDGEGVSHYCSEHAHANGFCYACGQFWGGIESFEFRPSGLCDNCEFEARHDDDEENAFDEDGYGECYESGGYDANDGTEGSN